MVRWFSIAFVPSAESSSETVGKALKLALRLKLCSRRSLQGAALHQRVKYRCILTFIFDVQGARHPTFFSFN